MQLKNMRPDKLSWLRTGRKPWLRLAQKLRPALLITGLIAGTVLLTWPTGSASMPSADDASVLVPASLMDEAIATIDSLEVEVAQLKAELAVQREYEAQALAEQQRYYVELLDIKDQRVASLEAAVKDAAGGKTKGILENILWGLGGYGVRAVTEK